MRSSIKSRDIIVPLFCFALIGLALWFFYYEKTQTVEYKGKYPIGEIERIRNTSQRIPGDRTIPIDLEKRGDVYLYETIIVNPDADSVLRIKLDEDYFSEEFTIDLSPGSYITFLPGGQVEVKGQVIVRNKEGEIKGEIEGSKKLAFSEESSGIEVEEVAVENLSPLSEDLFTSSESRQVTFRWNDLLPIENKEVQISTDINFRSVYLSHPVENNQNSATLTIPSGRFYWRVKGSVSNRISYGTASVFQIYRYIPPRPLRPENGNTINYVTELNENLQWRESSVILGSGSTKAEGYILQLSRDSGFTSSKEYKLGLRTQFSLTEKITEGDGRYYWRVLPLFNPGLKWSESTQLTGLIDRNILSSNFSIRRGDSHRPVELIFPTNGLSLSSVDAETGINFKWESDREAVSYRFQLSRDSGFSNIIKESEVDFNGWSDQTSLNPGNYYWRVVSQFSDDRQVTSTASAFEVTEVVGGIEMISPEPDVLIPLNQIGESVKFRWRSTGENYGFRIHLYKGNSDIPFLSRDVSGETFEWILDPESEYRWQIDVLSRVGRILRSGEIRSFEVAGPVLSPNVIYPAPGEKISLDGAEVLPIQWSEVGNSDFYRVTLINRRTNRAVLNNLETPLSRIEITNIRNLEPGAHTLTVQAVKRRAKGPATESEIAVSAFEITDVVVYGKPLLISPINNRTIDFYSQKKNGIPLSWSQNPAMPRFIVTVYEGQDGPLIYRKEVAEQNVSIPSLPQGTYSWDVLPVDAAGKGKTPSERGSFRISPAAGLSQSPDLVYPVNGTTIPMDQKNEIVFSWKPVEEADFYIVNIFRADSKENLVYFEEYKETTYTFNQLEKLKTGDYIFEVRAVKSNRDVGPGLEQMSPQVTGTFTLTLQKLSIPQVKSDDIQYTD